MENSSGFGIDDVNNINNAGFQNNGFGENSLQSDKDYNVTLLLSYFLGYFGAHRFYTGKIGTGILMLVTCGGCGVWALIDFIFILTGNFKDNNGLKVVSDKPFFKTWSNILVIILFVTSLILNIAFSGLLLSQIDELDLSNTDDTEVIDVEDEYDEEEDDMFDYEVDYEISLVSEGKAELEFNGEVYAYDVDSSLVYDEYGDISVPTDFEKWFSITSSAAEGDDIDSYCALEEELDEYGLTILSQNSDKDSCNYIIKIEGGGSTSYTASEAIYFKETDTLINHFYIGYFLTDDEFITYVNKTLNTTELK